MPPATDKPKQAKGPIKSLLDFGLQFFFDRKYFWHFTSLLFLGEILLGLLVIWKIPYTKIDWPAYMQQVGMFLDGEQDYSRIEGETGPLVYPALHLYIYTAFSKIMPSIDDVRPAQYIFLGIYLLTFLSVANIYYLAGRPSANGKHYVQALLVPLTLSKRAHSIFMLRLFNDPIAMLIFYWSVIAFQIGGRKGKAVSDLCCSLALGVKMNILLFVPGLLVLLFQYRGIYGLVEGVSVIALVQVALPAPFFLSSTNHALSYLSSAFDFSRQFLYEWTVNWRFINEELFLSRERAVLLLFGQVIVLLTFAAFKWSPIPGGAIRVVNNGLLRPSQSAGEPSILPAYHIPLVLFTSNLIGVIFARSLHYQFYSWYFHQLPFLLFSGGAWNSAAIGSIIWALIQWPWEVTPATAFTSLQLLGSHLVLLSGLFFRNPISKEVVPSNIKSE
ncbi:hypothetical protein I350_02781 [Cryptococcus amylolentus CBS 6273]|uniref:Dol-P-Man:Man(5)GlcNAc(2)-PP-Dol alpha-1,3-mannosyltransferase n=1 Tax=Cryptococcus amylolentus CBS 6273 TaxID=1296118 RepID=A0A1E3K7Y3_9TREE|nr:hypothetical protein I350_02781 [Cryptococcus amylolentus CBS 6273]